MSTSVPGCPHNVNDVDLFDGATQEDWYPTYDLLRTEAPVWQMPGTTTYVLTRFADVSHVLRRTDLFGRGSGASAPAGTIRRKMVDLYAERGWPRLMPLAVDPPVHRKYRELVDPFFSVQGAEVRRPMITGLVNQLLDGLTPTGRCEYVREFALPLPVQVITIMLGFRLDDIPQLKTWSEAWVLPFRGGLSDDEELYVAEQGIAFQHHIHATIAEKRADPDDSVISFLANEARFDGQRALTDAEIIGMADHLYIGGNETTTFALTSGLWLLLSRPDVHAQLLADRSKIRNFVEEALRMESPTMGLNRLVLADTSIAGVAIPKGATVHLRYAAANRDPDVFTCPADLDIERANANRHVAFAVGETHCPGAGLSRLEQNIALDLVLDRLPKLRFTPERNDFTHHRNFTLRAMKELWIDYDSATASAAAAV